MLSPQYDDLSTDALIGPHVYQITRSFATDTVYVPLFVHALYLGHVDTLSSYIPEGEAAYDSRYVRIFVSRCEEIGIQ